MCCLRKCEKSVMELAAESVVDPFNASVLRFHENVDSEWWSLSILKENFETGKKRCWL